MLMPKIIDYTILTEANSYDLPSTVRSYIENGWQPLGPVIKHSNSGYSQTMVKYEQPKPNQL